jgi:HlyD family secretion protein
MKLSRTQRIAAIALLLAGIVLFLVLRPAPLPVDSDVVTRAPLQVVLEGEGVTRVNDRYVISAPVTGKLMRITLEEGESVQKGIGLASILPVALDAREFREASARAGSGRAAMDEAVARERSVMLNLEQGRRRAARYKNLYSEGAVSRESFEIAEKEAGVLQKEAAAARSGSAAARYSYEALQSRVDSNISAKAVTVFSPVAGKILRVHEKSERVVNAGAPLIDIGDPSAIEIVIDVLSSDAVMVRKGSRVIVTDWGGGRDAEAVVKTVEPSAFTKISALGIEEKRVNIIAALKNYEPLLGDNFRVQARIVLAETASAVQVPVSGLFRGKTSWEVFVIRNGRAVLRPVVLGMRGIWQAEVLKGLSPGERVVVHPTNELRNGMRVKTKE